MHSGKRGFYVGISLIVDNYFPYRNDAHIMKTMRTLTVKAPVQRADQ